MLFIPGSLKAEDLARRTDLEVLKTFVLYYLQEQDTSKALGAIDRFLEFFPTDEEVLDYRDQVRAGKLDSVRTKLLSKLGWSAELASQFGTHSNVLQLSNQTLSALDRSETLSLFYGFRGAFEASIRYPRELYTFLTQLSSRTYLTDEAENLSSLSGGLSISYQRELRKPGHFGIETNVFFSSLQEDNYDLYNLSPDLTFVYDRRLGANHLVSLRLPLRYQHYTQAPVTVSQDRTGPEIGLSLHYRSFWTKHMIGLGFEFLQTFVEGLDVRSQSYGVPLSLRSQWLDNLQSHARVNWKFVNYYRSSLDRTDHLLGSDVGLRWMFLDSWFLAPSYSFLKSFSSESTNDYDRHEVMMEAGYAF